MPGTGEQLPVCTDKLCHLFGDSPGTLDELLLGVGITGAALKGTCLGDQSSTAMAQLLHPVLDVGPYLKRQIEFTRGSWGISAVVGGVTKDAGKNMGLVLWHFR